MRKLYMILLCLCLFLGNGILTFAETQYGDLGITLTLDAKALLKSKQQSETYIYVQEIDSGKTYKLPLNPENDFDGRYAMPYGNYRVVDPTDPLGVEIVYNSVFAIDNKNNNVSIECEAKDTEIKENTKEAAQGKSDTASGAGATTSSSDSEDKKNIFDFQTIFTICIVTALVIVYIYGKIKKKQEED